MKIKKKNEMMTDEIRGYDATDTRKHMGNTRQRCIKQDRQIGLF